MATDNTNIVSALNAGSGINIRELAQALVDAEKVPRESLVQSKIDKSSAKISGLGIVKNVLDRFKGSFQKLDSAADFKQFSVTKGSCIAILPAVSNESAEKEIQPPEKSEKGPPL